MLNKDYGKSIPKSDPREEINQQIRNENSEVLLLAAGRLHGHYCPGLAMGVMAAMKAVNALSAFSDGMEDTLAITETNNCFSDGVQYVTGCTFGNNALIFKDMGKTAFTLVNRDGKGIRICSKHESREVIREAFPDFEELYQKVVVEQNRDDEMLVEYKQLSVQRSFGTLDIPFDRLFSVSRPEVKVPDYASIHDSVVCDSCHESVMESRTIKKNGKILCLSCAGSRYYYLCGDGIKS
jgi:formylmethanofuran dehydrogenase subunit E